MSIQFVKSLFFCLAVLSPYGLAYSQISSEEIFKSIDRENISSSPAIFWQQFGPGMSGNTKAVFWHPYDPNVLYISPNMGNSYCSIDKGHTYQTILDADGASIKTGLRGPREILDIDFSKQDRTSDGVPTVVWQGCLLRTIKAQRGSCMPQRITPSPEYSYLV